MIWKQEDQFLEDLALLFVIRGQILYVLLENSCSWAEEWDCGQESDDASHTLEWKGPVSPGEYTAAGLSFLEVEGGIFSLFPWENILSYSVASPLGYN